MSGSRSSMSRNALRTTAWSSARTTEILSDAASLVLATARNLTSHAGKRGTYLRAQLAARSAGLASVGKGADKRAFAALLLTGLLCAGVALVPAGTLAKKRGHKTQKRPNIVLIMDDDQSVNLQQFLTKTNADIGSRGVTFDNSFVNYSLCCPSRSTMLTGQYAHNHCVRGNQLPSGGYSKLAPTLGNTLPVWLQRAGYYTAHIGKFLNGYGATSPDTEVPPG